MVYGNKNAKKEKKNKKQKTALKRNNTTIQGNLC